MSGSNPDATAAADAIAAACAGAGAIRLMEVCGTHTVAIFRAGLKSLLPDNLALISGPGCPVCVTSRGYIDAACRLALGGEAVVATFGDMLRVPGEDGSLADVKARGGDVRMVYSARDALKIAADNPRRPVVFLAVGFETTAPSTAAAVSAASARGLDNFSILPAHKLIIPAMAALLAGDAVPIDGFLCPGHVSVIIGAAAYRPIAEQYARPCVVAGFEPAGILEAIRRLCLLVTSGEAAVENAYEAAVSPGGNAVARAIMNAVFQPGPAVWRAMGTIPASGLCLREEYAAFDARQHFAVAEGPDASPPGCRCGEVIQGKCTPPACPLFGTGCTPVAPVGPCMVSSEGTCAAWFKYGR